MSRFVAAVGITWVLLSANLVVAAEPASAPAAAPAAVTVEEPIDIDEKSTHEQVQLIEVPKTAKLNAFCLDTQGQILAACGNGPGEIRVMDANGELLTSWEVSIKPEAINTAPDGTILVAGHGKLLRFSPEGKLLKEADSPHAIAVQENEEALRKEAETQVNRPVASLGTIIESYKRMITQLEEKQKNEELNEQEVRLLQILPENVEKLEERKKQEDEAAESKEKPDNTAKIEQALNSLKVRKLRIASISTDGKHVYIATPATLGYRFEVWQTSLDFTGGEKVVTELRGCCSQMDVQACESGIYVAENARHRVACFQPNGEMVNEWGKRDRSGKDGFTSCCNPMNVCFNKNGDVYTAESNTGRITRFSADGEFKEYVGDVKLVPGCKNVSIAVSPDNDTVYMLDITRNHIVVMKRKAQSPTEPSTEVTSVET
ncbi:hypothetical protein AB1K70_23905 [Bremerella sp. JC770]|uniref:hypothetical protein n=1 Tax=Bremerella sp. JC770 TaxID=3232137 RepID=UPI003457FABE